MSLPRSWRSRLAAGLRSALAGAFVTTSAQASLFTGETLDTVANALSWVVLVVVPIAGITVFWLVHILPEKIAEDRRHPQAKAIQTLCLLSLVFGGLLWPLAWLWAYSKPVLYKLAYGTDVSDEPHGSDAKVEPVTASPSRDEVARLRERLAQIEAQLPPEARG